MWAKEPNRQLYYIYFEKALKGGENKKFAWENFDHCFDFDQCFLPC